MLFVAEFRIDARSLLLGHQPIDMSLLSYAVNPIKVIIHTKPGCQQECGIQVT